MHNVWTDVDALARLARSEHKAERDSLGARASRRGEPETILYPPFRSNDRFEFHTVESPARMVSGDYADGMLLPGGTLAVVMADVSGKGIPAAVVMGISRSVIRNICAYSGSPGDALTRVHKILYEADLDSIFLSIFLGYLDLRSGAFRYANAGHPLPYRIAADGEVRRFGTVTGPVLGILNVGRYAEQEERLGRGEALLLYTDGITEAKSPLGEFFGDERLRGLLAEHGRAPVAALCTRVAAAIEEFQGGIRHDDATLLAVRRSG
jgi:phosphoserine phosphatase RsbU/P